MYLQTSVRSRPSMSRNWNIQRTAATHYAHKIQLNNRTGFIEASYQQTNPFDRTHQHHWYYENDKCIALVCSIVGRWSMGCRTIPNSNNTSTTTGRIEDRNLYSTIASVTQHSKYSLSTSRRMQHQDEELMYTWCDSLSSSSSSSSLCSSAYAK